MNRLLLLLLAFGGVPACATTAPASRPTVAITPASPSVPQAAAAPSPRDETPTATRLLAASRAPFDACYLAARKTNPNLGRTVVEVTFTVDPSGKLESVDFAYQNRFDDAAKECMRTAAEGLTIPPSLSGTQTGTIRFSPP